MKRQLLIVVCVATSAAFALPPVRPALPPVAYIDAETTTNVQFTAWQEHVGKFKLSQTCRTTTTNNVQFAFGRDSDDDGTLALEESDLVVGWDCGKWFVQGGYDAERIETAVGTATGRPSHGRYGSHPSRRRPCPSRRPLTARRCLEVSTPGWIWSW